MIVGYDRAILREYNYVMILRLDIQKYPHTIITGKSGSGKSSSLLFLIHNLAMQFKLQLNLYICDYKASGDFAFLKNHVHYYEGDDCLQGIQDYYNYFIERKSNPSVEGQFNILIFDEYPGFINRLIVLDKMNKSKQANEVLGIISELLMLGRSLGFSVWVVCQRPDASLFNGSRDNFMNFISLGNIQKEHARMIFDGIELPDETLHSGESYILSDDPKIGFQQIVYPYYREDDELKNRIIKYLSCEAG